MQKIPNVGEVVRRNGKEDWVAQIRIDHGKPDDKDYWIETGILIWASTKQRFVVGDQWSAS